MTESHGYRGTPTYTTWIEMRRRCSNPRRKDYPRYGGRGIRVCASWQESFMSFLSDMGERPKGMTLDRIDTDGDYCKSNCRWATSTEQLRNTRLNSIIEFNGESKCIADWSEETGISANCISKRLADGWEVSRALTEKSRHGRKGVAHNSKPVEYEGVSKTLKEWAADYGINYHTLRVRVLKYGWSMNEALNTPPKR